MRISELSDLLGPIVKDKKVLDRIIGGLTLEYEQAPFGAPIISLSDSDTVYPDRSGNGGKSVKLAEVMVPINSVGMAVKASVYTRLKPTSDGYEIETTASLSRDAKINNAEQKTAFLAHVENAVAAWNGFPTAEAAAIRKLTGVKTTPVVGEAMRPRLVKTLAKPGAAPEQPTV
jgi:hypothetical protein